MPVDVKVMPPEFPKSAYKYRNDLVKREPRVIGDALEHLALWRPPTGAARRARIALMGMVIELRALGQKAYSGRGKAA